MMRTRFLWFTLGFTSASATMTHFIFRDLWADRLSLSSQLKEKFGVLGTRVSNLESALHDIPNTHQIILLERTLEDQFTVRRSLEKALG